MSLAEIERRRCEKALRRFLEKRRPPPEIRSQVDLDYRIVGQSIEIFSIRPAWRNPQTKVEGSIAKATYVRSRDQWNVFWQRADLKWHRYEPEPAVRSFEQFLALVEADEYCCFFG